MIYNKFYCQHCGSDRKLVHQVMYDEVMISEEGVGVYIGLTDDFDNLGAESCAKCGNEWTGIELIDSN